MSQTREEFVKRWSPFVNQITAGTGLFAETVLSQAIVESQGRTGLIPGTQLSRDHNNYFGIKAGSGWRGQTVSLKTGEVFNGKAVVITDAFRKYATPEDSFRDYVQFLRNNPRYTRAGVFAAKTPAEQAQALQRAGYATNPRYAELIAAVGRGIQKWIIPNTGSIAALAAAILFFLLITKPTKTATA
jgi:flagellar protein FlgJ